MGFQWATLAVPGAEACVPSVRLVCDVQVYMFDPWLYMVDPAANITRSDELLCACFLQLDV
jgi:hypothetical protein